MLKKCLFAMALVSFAAQSVLAQPALPVCKRPVDLGELVQAIRTNDRKILNADCSKIVDSYNATFQPAEAERPKSCEDLALIFERLNVDKAPQGVKASFSRIMRDGSTDLYGFSRPVRPGEEWAYDNQLGTWTLSMICCNFISDNNLPIPRQHVDVVAQAPVAPQPSPEELERLMKRAVADELAKHPLQAAPAPAALASPAPTPSPEKKKGWAILKEKKVWIPLAAVGVGAAACGVNHCLGNTQTVTVTNVIR